MPAKAKMTIAERPKYLLLMWLRYVQAKRSVRSQLLAERLTPSLLPTPAEGGDRRYHLETGYLRANEKE